MHNLQSYTNKFFDLVTKYLRTIDDTTTPVVQYQSPDALREIFDFKINTQGISPEELLQQAGVYLQYAVNTSNHQFFNQLYAGFNAPAFWGEVMTTLTNTSMATYEIAPVATLIEKELINKMCQTIGYRNGSGIFVTGGSNANLVAMFSARNKLFPEARTNGLYGLPKLSAFISDQAHYSLDNDANLLGIGVSLVYKVKTDSNGSMIVSELEKAIQLSLKKGEKPFFIAATAGTTMLGAFDPFDQIADVVSRYGIWFHIDGAFGGSLVLTPKTKPLFAGAEKSNSFTWDAHKIMNIPIICSAILINEPHRLRENLTSTSDDYLFHDTETSMYDTGKSSIQCGRRVDALKLWMAWKFYGDQGYQARIEHLLDIAHYFEQKIKTDPNFELTAPRQTLTVCFRYLPNDKQQTDAINLQIREHLRKKGTSMVNFGYIASRFTFRWIISNADVSEQDVDSFFYHFYAVVKELGV